MSLYESDDGISFIQKDPFTLQGAISPHLMSPEREREHKERWGRVDLL